MLIVAATKSDEHALSDWATPEVLYHVLAPKTGERHGQGARLQPLGTLALQRPTEEHSVALQRPTVIDAQTCTGRNKQKSSYKGPKLLDI